MVPPWIGWGWQTTAATRGSRSSGSSNRASSRPTGPGIQCDSIRRATSIRAVVDELRVDAEIALAEQLDCSLENVAVFAGNAREVTIDGSLHFELAVLDLLDDLARLFDGDALLERDLLFHR